MPDTVINHESEGAVLDVLRKRVWGVLALILDPEMPISIVDLGMVEDVKVVGKAVEIALLPTMVGCPALPMIEDEVVEKVGLLEGVDGVAVEFVHRPAWSVDRISEAGRADLRAFGVTVPACGCGIAKENEAGDGGVEFRISAWQIACPFCESLDTRVESPFGPTRCRMIYFCESCLNTFEHMKKLD